MAVAIVLVVAGFYLYARYSVKSAIKEIPKNLGVDIQQSTEGFSLSKSEGGRTLFTIKASRAVQYKQGGRAALKDVSIVVYGRKSNRFDQITGSDFEYDPQTGEVSAKGDVHIDLEGNAEGPASPDQATPQELKNPIHLKTSGLVFNQKTGFANTDQPIEFRVPQAAGSAVGASYDSKANLLTLKSNVNIVTTGPQPTTIDADHGSITKEPRQVVLNGVKVQQTARNIDADAVTMLLRPDNSLEHVVATGNVRLHDTGPNRMLVRAPRADLNMGQKNTLRSAVFSGGVQMEASGDTAMTGTAGTVTLAFAGNNKLNRVVASNNVHLVQQSGKKQSQTAEINADALTLSIKNGKLFESAETNGPAQILLVSQEPRHAGERTTITAGKFRGEFDGRNRLTGIKGEPGAKVVSTYRGQPDKVATSRSLEVQFTPAGAISSIVQQGGFEYREAQAAAGAQSPTGPGGRSAIADSARYSPSDEIFTLNGAPRVTEGGLAVSANTIRLNRRSGDATAEGDVKSTYSEIKQDPNGAMIATSDPVHVTAKSATVRRQTGVARYTGGARLWQGPNIVEAATIEFDRNQRSINALGNGSTVSSVFVQADKSGKTTPITVNAAKLSYVDSQRKARFSGGVLVKGADITVSADHVDIVLHASARSQSPSSAPSQLDQIIAEKDVVVRQTDRRASGDKLVFTTADGKFVLNGGSPSISDAEHGTIRGDSLTFYSRNDRVLVESNNSSRTVTRTRVSR